MILLAQETGLSDMDSHKHLSLTLDFLGTDLGKFIYCVKEPHFRIPEPGPTT